jgi:oxalate decarboxylase/phosphoglucose isomerase-like protein (cupin superfamily)
MAPGPKQSKGKWKRKHKSEGGEVNGENQSCNLFPKDRRQHPPWLPLSAGSVVFIPPDEEHQLKNVADESLIFVCVIPSGFPEI